MNRSYSVVGCLSSGIIFHVLRFIAEGINEVAFISEPKEVEEGYFGLNTFFDAEGIQGAIWISESIFIV